MIEKRGENSAAQVATGHRLPVSEQEEERRKARTKRKERSDAV